MMLQYRSATPLREKLRLANTIVSEYIAGTRSLFRALE